MPELIILGTAKQVPTRARSQRPVIDLRSIQVRPYLAAGVAASAALAHAAMIQWAIALMTRRLTHHHT